MQEELELTLNYFWQVQTWIYILETSEHLNSDFCFIIFFNERLT